MADTIKTNLGPVTAYADAKAHGYTGTREEFGQLLANAGLNLKAAETAKADAEAAKQLLATVRTRQLTVLRMQRKRWNLSRRTIAP